jgi:hypothetical protein
MVEKADANGVYAKGRRALSYHWWLKRWKARAERRRARKALAKGNYEDGDSYGKYSGWEL